MSTAETIEGLRALGGSYPPPWLRLLGLGLGAGAAAVVLAALTGKIEGFDINIPDQLDKAEGYTSQPPPVDVGGYSGETIPTINIVYSNTDPLSPAEREYLEWKLIEEGFLNGPTSEPLSAVVAPSGAIVDEVTKAVEDIAGGENPAVVLDRLSPGAYATWNQVVTQLDMGREVVLTDRTGDTITKLSPGSKGVRH